MDGYVGVTWNYTMLEANEELIIKIACDKTVTVCSPLAFASTQNCSRSFQTQSQEIMIQGFPDYGSSGSCSFCLGEIRIHG